MEYIRCNLCGDDNYKIISKKGYLFTYERVVACKNCGLVYLNPRQSETEIESFYANNYRSLFSGSVSPNSEIIEEHEQRAQRRIDFFRETFPKLEEGRILEIGCAAGNFLNLMKKAGWMCLGVEAGIAFSEYAKKEYELEIVTDLYENIKFQSTSYDVISLFHVLEHLRNPTRALSDFNRMLNGNGILFLEIPDVHRASLDVKNYFQKSHIYDFSATTIRALLAKCGFEVVNCQYDKYKPKNLMILSKKNELYKKQSIHFVKEDYMKVISLLNSKRKKFIINKIRKN